jgi:hypothetical protein
MLEVSESFSSSATGNATDLGWRRTWSTVWILVIVYWLDTITVYAGSWLYRDKIAAGKTVDQ